MNTTQLEYFVSVAELHSFTKAAQKHYVSQTAVTQQIQNLEEILNTTLFDRTKRPIQLTDEGTMLLTDAKAILERMYGAVAKLSNVSSSVGGSLRIGYTKSYERSSLSAMLRRYHRDYPNVFLSCCRHNSKELTEALLSGALDHDFHLGSRPDYGHASDRICGSGALIVGCGALQRPPGLCTVRSCAGKI